MIYISQGDSEQDREVAKFADHLAAEVRLQTGQEFPITLHSSNMAADQNLEATGEIGRSATLLIPVLSPFFFRDETSRREVRRFLDRERETGRNDLILPIYYISTPEMEEPSLREADQLAEMLSVRQYADWRQLRFEPWTSPSVRKALAQLAGGIQEILSGGVSSASATDVAPSLEPASGPISDMARLVFVSYSHQDRKILRRLQVHLNSLERLCQIALWDDTRIRAGDKWQDEIRNAIESCRVAILIISADFMASDFIQNIELPSLLIRAQQRGVFIFSIIAGYSNFEDTELAQFQTVNHPSQPLMILSRPEREAILLNVYKLVKAALSRPDGRLPLHGSASTITLAFGTRHRA